ncbi:AlpA family transcriptional regulator [Mycobacterium sp. E2699]|uniref:helix-turn-helix transcriptional regulator n=1 Tax=Mycobacterium sp. E2699 TaxID=1834137 RepID=UPI0009EE198D|nr:helix-turn-helix domain-containing protein [Mycobacterium sp. E2699]
MIGHTEAETPLPPLLSPSQAAAYAGVDRKTIYRRIEDGTLPAVRFGPRCLRVRREDLLKLLEPPAPQAKRRAG